MVEISFWTKPNHPTEEFVKPFVNVRRVNVWHGNFDKQLPSFVDWFPRLLHLELHNVQLNHGYIVAHFQQLEHLCIDDYRNSGLSCADATKLIHSNRQLKCLEIRAAPHKMPIDTMLDFIKDNNQSIDKLDLTYQFGEIAVDATTVQRLINQHPSLVELNLPNHHFAVNDVITLTQQRKSLKRFGYFTKNSADFEVTIGRTMAI